MKNEVEFAGDADIPLIAYMSAGTSDTASKTDSDVHVVVLTNGTTLGQSIRDVTLATQQRWKTHWRQRANEFDTAFTVTRANPK